MAKYELGAIYKINGRSGELYYVRLLTNDCYGVFSSLEGELNEETLVKDILSMHLLKPIIVSILAVTLFL